VGEGKRVKGEAPGSDRNKGPEKGFKETAGAYHARPSLACRCQGRSGDKQRCRFRPQRNRNREKKAWGQKGRTVNIDGETAIDHGPLTAISNEKGVRTQNPKEGNRAMERLNRGGKMGKLSRKGWEGHQALSKKTSSRNRGKKGKEEETI